MRLFIAAELSDALKDKLEDIPRAVRLDGVRLVPRDQMHLTVRFLGEVEPERLADIEAALRAACARHAAHVVEVKGGGVFGHPRHPRVVWVGLVDPTARLTALAAAVEQALVDVGFPPEERPFRAHLTLGRPKGRPRIDLGALEALPSLGPLRVDALVLFRSTTGPQGAVHTPLVVAPLAAAVTEHPTHPTHPTPHLAPHLAPGK